MRLFIIRVKFVVGWLKDYLCSAHNETVNNYGKPIGRNGVAQCSKVWRPRSNQISGLYEPRVGKHVVEQLQATGRQNGTIA